jgi:predicted SPOUT superfamily RNA methylase MTH1
LEKKLRSYSIHELELEDEDLQMTMTLGMVIGGTYLNLLKLKKWVEDDDEFKIVWKTFSSQHLRVVKKEQFEEFLEWKKQRM